MDIFKHLKDNKAALIAEKKFKVKEADAIVFTPPIITKDSATKEDSDIEVKDLKSITVSVVINTTNIMDSHGDVHMTGIWNKSLKETKLIYLLQEHQMKFDKIISDKVKASAKTMSWSDLGFTNLKGDTQALVFDVVIDSERNEFMFEQYLKGYVKEHSVGMRYISMELCINSEDKYYLDEKENWDKYIKEVANKDEAIAQGFFWAVTEAKIMEGSAVVKGSNYATPTISVTPTKNIEAAESTSNNENKINNKQFFINQLKN